MSTPQTHDHDGLLTQALRDLDAAPPAPLTAEQQTRADATLAGILGGATTADAASTARAPMVPIRPSRPRRRVARGVLLVAAALAVTLVVSMSGLLGGGTAYASWTPRPLTLAAAEQESLAQECRDSLADSAETAPPLAEMPTAADLRATRLVLADTRGHWTYVVLEGANGLEANCLADHSGGFRLFPWFSTASISSYGFTEVPAIAPGQIFGTSLMATAASEGSYWATEGHVGSAVASVTVVTSTGARVEATVTGGRFAAWWPQRESIDGAGGLAQARYVVTLTDGTVLPEQTYDDIIPVFEE